MRITRLFPALLVVLAAAPASLRAAPYADALIRDVPHILQKPDFCGEACAEMALRKLGRPITQDQVFNLARLDPALGRGCYTPELNTALTAVGFKTGTVYYTIPAADAGAALDRQFQALHADLLVGIPSIVCMHYSDAPTTTEHFRLILGYDAGKDEVIYHEPAEKTNAAYRHMKRAMFLKLWPLANGTNGAMAIRFRLEPGPRLAPAQGGQAQAAASPLLAAAAPAANAPSAPVAAPSAPPAAPVAAAVAAVPAGFTDADYAQHVLKLKEKMPAGFAVVVQKPFVVIGDSGPAAVRSAAQQTVKWAVDKLKQDYFAKDPEDILDVWLFKDKTSYDKYTKEIFNDEPSTPYGYYSPAHRALIMNIGTGGGTLVHEIVHPFMRTNFPECPAWFNEGMGSLYEQSSERDGHIVGMTNWRLAGLQKAIKAKNVPTFEKLTGFDDDDFYRADRGTNYAQSRYLLYYLQEKGLLVKYFKEFTANRKADPTGYKSLVKILDEKDMAAFQKRWETWVLQLTFP